MVDQIEAGALFVALYKSGNGFDLVDGAEAEKLIREYGIEVRPAAKSDAETLRADLDAGSPSGGNRYHYRVRSFETAEALAALMGGGYAAADAGPHCSPRFTVFRFPAVGDPVSYGFNGDYYPDGQIVKVGTGPKAKITTSTGSVYYRRKLSASWTKPGGTWALVHGHHDRRNPHL